TIIIPASIDVSFKTPLMQYLYPDARYSNTFLGSLASFIMISSRIVKPTVTGYIFLTSITSGLIVANSVNSILLISYVTFSSIVGSNFFTLANYIILIYVHFI